VGDCPRIIRGTAEMGGFSHTSHEDDLSSSTDFLERCRGSGFAGGRAT
jgi:hypothetical protein